MADEASVINRALRFLGERPISNPESPDTDSAKHIVEIFPQGRRELLRLYPWNFAEVWDEIDKTTAPKFGYSDAYALPATFLRLLWVLDPDQSTLDYRLLYQPAPDNRRVIALDNGGASKLKIGFGADVEILAHWEPLALKALSLWLALDACKGITGREKHVEMLNELLSETLKDAFGVDGSEQSIKRHVESYTQNERNRAQYGYSAWTNVTGYY